MHGRCRARPYACRHGASLDPGDRLWVAFGAAAETGRVVTPALAIEDWLVQPIPERETGFRCRARQGLAPGPRIRGFVHSAPAARGASTRRVGFWTSGGPSPA